MSVPLISERRWPALTTIALALLALAVTIYFLAVLRLDLYNTAFLNMDPHPDADEYMASAVSFTKEGTFRIHNAGRMVPSRYPFGFSLLMSPLVRLGVDPATVPFRFNQMLGLALILVSFAVFWRAGNRLGAGLTSLYMATVPGVLTLARSPMSDLLGGAIVLTGYYCFWKFVRSRPGDISWAVAGTMVLAIGVWVRIPNLMYLGIIGFAGFFGQAVPLRQRVRTLVLLGLAFAVAIVPLLVFNYLSFDHPMRTGYDFWMPRQDGGSSAAPVVAFSSYRLTAQRHFIWHEIIQHENWMNIAYLFGTGSYLNPTLVLIAIVGAATALMSRDRAAVVIGCAAMLTFIPVLMLRTSDPRNWIAFPMMLPFVAGRQMSLLFRQAARPPRRDWVSIVAIVLLSAAAVAGWPGRNATFETKELIDVARFRGRSELNLAVRHLDRLTTGQRTLVITNFNTSYVYALTDGDRIVSPFRAIDMPTFSERWFPPQARRAQLREALSSGRTVYGLLMSGPPERYLPPPAGYEWEPVWRGRRSIVLARLVKL